MAISETFVTSHTKQYEEANMANVTPKEMKPVAVEISKNLDPNWKYFDSVKKVRRLYLKWSSVSSEILRELYIAKLAITKGGSRKSGLPKKGEMSWNRYIEEAFGGMVSKRTIDSHLLAYQHNGFQKPGKLTVSTISDHSKVVVKSATKETDGLIKVEIYLPEFDTTYIQRFSA
jgi:hypothetical protein